MGRRDEVGDWEVRIWVRGTSRSDLCFGRIPLAGEDGAWTNPGAVGRAQVWERFKVELVLCAD